jgi:hypothetical protein
VRYNRHWPLAPKDRTNLDGGSAAQTPERYVAHPASVSVASDGLQMFSVPVGGSVRRA